MKTKTISIEQAMKDGNSSANQTIKQKFIGREVFCNVGTLVEYCLLMAEHNSQAPFGYDDIENFYSLPEYRGEYADFDGGTDAERDAEIERLKEVIEGIEDQNTSPSDFKSVDKITEEIEILENLESEPQEVLEWWAVSSYLFDKLKEKGHPVVDVGSCYVWGRCTSGQAILLDYVITQICAEMGILDGQENSWK
jgi:hypothetical protein